MYIIVYLFISEVSCERYLYIDTYIYNTWTLEILELIITIKI